MKLLFHEEIEHILLKNKVPKSTKILVAVSGGADSMALAWSLYLAGFKIEIAHCNFKLRGQESDNETDFVKSFFNKHKIPFHFKIMDTESYAQKYKVSIQVAARNLRYDWFNELIQTRQLDNIATGHHLEDQTETVIWNLLRGTGLKGVAAMKIKSGNILRPLLPFSKECILEYLKNQNIQFVTDSSNLSDKYSRNYIRHHISTHFKHLNNNAFENIANFSKKASEAENLLSSYSKSFWKKLKIQQQPFEIYDLQNQVIQNATQLYYLLDNYGFFVDQIDTIYEKIQSLNFTGSFLSKGFKLVLYRNQIQLISLKKLEEFQTETSSIKLEPGNSTPWNHFIFNCEIVEGNDNWKASDGKIYLPIELANSELLIRSWQTGDTIEGFGMKGKKQKLKKIFTDSKLSILDKTVVPIICLKQEILWVAGFKTSNQLAIKKGETKAIQLTFNKLNPQETDN